MHAFKANIEACFKYLSRIRGRGGNAKAEIVSLNDFLLGLLQEHFEDIFPPPVGGSEEDAAIRAGKKRARVSDAIEVGAVGDDAVAAAAAAAKKGARDLVPMSDKQKVTASN